MIRRQLGACPAIVALLSMAASFAAHALPEPTAEWFFETGVGLETTPVPYPGTNPDSVLIGTGGRVFRIGGDGKVIFDSAFGPESSRGGIVDVSLADLNGDGREEIVSAHKEGHVFILDGQVGRVLWKFQVTNRLGPWQWPVPADLDGDGKAEILVPDTDGWLTCLGPDGKLRWRTRTESTGTINEISTPAVGDIDNDGRPEIVYGTQTRHIVALKADGSLFWDRFVAPLHAGRTQPLIADLDGDGNAEIYSMSSMLAADGGVIALNGSDGNVRWAGPTDTNVYHGRSLARFDDGSLGLIVADKANSVSAFNADGARRWQTHVSGRGIWQPPACADLDGDGRFELLVTVRDKASDGSDKTWYALDASSGEVAGAYSIESGYGGACVADIDRDGQLEVVLASRLGKVHAFGFGGPAKPAAVVSGTWNAQPYPLRKEPASAAAPATPPPAEQTLDLPDARYGYNNLTLLADTPNIPRMVEVTTVLPDGTRETQVARLAKGEKQPVLEWPVVLPGAYEVAVRYVEATPSSGRTLSVTRLKGTIENLALALDASTFREPLNETVATLKHVSQRSPQSSVALARRWTEAETRIDLLGTRIARAAELSLVEREHLAEEMDDLIVFLQRTRAYARTIKTEVDAKREPSFLLWPDANPWDDVNPLDTVPRQIGPCTVDAWAFGNETESVCVNAVNLAADPLALRVGPAQILKEGQDEPVKAAPDAVRLFNPVRLPSRFGREVPDLLPPLGDDYLLHVAPGQAQQIWINLSTKSLEPGKYRITWPVTTLDQPPARQVLTVRLDVSPVRLPDKSRYLLNTWARNRIDGVSTVPDLNEHLQNVWYGLPLPAAKADAQGNLVGDLDWTEHDAILSEIAQCELLLYNPPPTPAFPEGVQPTEEQVRTARASYVRALVDHLSGFGLGYRNFMWYVEDEPGLVGSIANYMRHARELKAIDSQAQNYANPWGAVNLAKVEEMSPVTDVWQPGMDTLEQLGQPYVDAMRQGDKRILTYTPPDNARILHPLGFYRAQAWLCLHWGIDGGGWWTYYQGDDLFDTRPEKEPSYGAVTWDGRALIGSRRWEANRDGAEDFNAVWLLRDLAQAKGDAQAETVIQDAVGYVAGTALTGMPREAAPYDLDYKAFSAYRMKIRHELERLR